MEQFIINYIESINCRYVKINDESDLLIIYDLFKNNVVGDKYSSMICFYYGFYYRKIKPDYDLMKKYYLLSIDHHNVDAMIDLAFYYECVEKDYDLMKKYYLMAIDNNYSNSMARLAHYYRHTEHNYDLMKKYYLMAIDGNHSNSMNNLGIYYGHKEQNYDLMKKYYLMAINHNNPTSMYNLAHHYQYIEKDYDMMKKYYFMAIKNKNVNAINKCSHIYKTTSQENINDAMYFYNIANKTNEKYDAITTAINNNYMINNNHMIDYIQSMNISILLSKYNNMCVNIKQVFINYRQIMLLLWIIKNATYIIPKHVKLNLISLLCV